MLEARRFRYRRKLQEAIVLIPEVTFLRRSRDFLSETCAEGICARDDDSVFDTKLEKGIANCTNFGEKLLVRNGNLAVLMAALLCIRHLVLELNRTGTSLDHSLSQKIRCLFVAEPSVYVCNDRHYMCLIVIYLFLYSLRGNVVA